MRFRLKSETILKLCILFIPAFKPDSSSPLLADFSSAEGKYSSIPNTLSSLQSAYYEFTNNAFDSLHFLFSGCMGN